MNTNPQGDQAPFGGGGGRKKKHFFFSHLGSYLREVCREKRAKPRPTTQRETQAPWGVAGVNEKTFFLFPFCQCTHGSIYHTLINSNKCWSHWLMWRLLWLTKSRCISWILHQSILFRIPLPDGLCLQTSNWPEIKHLKECFTKTTGTLQCTLVLTIHPHTKWLYRLTTFY